MSTAEWFFPGEQIRPGPIKSCKVATTSPRADQPVAESVVIQTVPFDEIKHLISKKPLFRAPQTEPRE